MQHIHVTTSSELSEKNKPFMEAVSDIVSSPLYSLVDGVNTVNFGLHTVSNVAQKIEYCQQLLFPDGKMHVDSGGYSIITGAVDAHAIPSVIECWEYYAKNAIQDYDYIFSLDIPLSLKYNSLNKADRIYELNKLSIRKLLSLIERTPEIRGKVLFVWQFKMEIQYLIWKALFDEYNLAHHINHMAVGGMVGINKITGIQFAPFIGICYRILLDFVLAEPSRKVFKIHLLGMNLMHDRFHIAFMERLFNDYMKALGVPTQIVFSYDSINYAQTSRKDINQTIYDLEGESIQEYQNATTVPIQVLEKVYERHGLTQSVMMELDRRKNGFRLNNSSALVPLSVYSNMALDRLFEHIIQITGIIDIFFSQRSITAILGVIHPILSDLQRLYPSIFTNHMAFVIKNNIEITHRFHQWFMDKRDHQSFEEHIHWFINKIGFPEMIST